MPNNDAPSYAFDLPPAEAIKHFRAKGLKSSFAWQDVWGKEHASAFTVAKMADVDLLQDVKDAVDQAIAEGWTLDEFKKALTPRLQKAGWWGVREQVDPVTQQVKMVQLGSARRLQTIFRTNMQTAYAAGNWAQIQEAKADAPYLMYDAVNDNRTRPQHRAWDGTVLPADDEFWVQHYPPNGYNCRCTVVQMGGDELAAYGMKVTARPPTPMREYVNKRTGEVMEIPEGIDPGFDYNPGMNRDGDMADELARRTRVLKGE